MAHFIYNPPKFFMKKKRLKTLITLTIGGILGIFLIFIFHITSEYTSTDEFCMKCHVHPHAETSWKLSTHVHNRSGIKVHCVDCHLPPKSEIFSHHWEKAKLGIRDVWSYITKDSSEFDWEKKATLEHAITYIPNQSCVACHQNLYSKDLSNDGITAHIYYEENQKKLNLQCINCHLDVGHMNPHYKHGKMTAIPISIVEDKPIISESFSITSFTDFNEGIPGTSIEISMKAIPGGSFDMGCSPDDSFCKADELPSRRITISPFFMAETEITWEQYWAFYTETQSEGRIAPEEIFAHNSNPDVDAVSGPTPPFGLVNQGWEGNDRPAITMTHYAATVFCQWLSKKTGKYYRLPTEAEWEYAARGGTSTPYFFEGNPSEFSDQGFWRFLFSPRTDVIGDYVIYSKNSKNKTQSADKVKVNPFGLKNMLGNVFEYCADKYDSDAYKHNNTENPLNTEGNEWVIRGGNYTSDASDVRCSARHYTKHKQWLNTDPQQPQSIWWYSDVKGIGFRVVCESVPKK